MEPLRPEDRLARRARVRRAWLLVAALLVACRAAPGSPAVREAAPVPDQTRDPERPGGEAGRPPRADAVWRSTSAESLDSLWARLRAAGLDAPSQSAPGQQLGSQLQELDRPVTRLYACHDVLPTLRGCLDPQQPVASETLVELMFRAAPSITTVVVASGYLLVGASEPDHARVEDLLRRLRRLPRPAD